MIASSYLLLSLDENVCFERAQWIGMEMAACDRWALDGWYQAVEHSGMAGLRTKGMLAFARMDEDPFPYAFNEL